MDSGIALAPKSGKRRTNRAQSMLPFTSEVRPITGAALPRPEVFFRTILFKLFNKIETWELLVKNFGPPNSTDFEVGPLRESTVA